MLADCYRDTLERRPAGIVLDEMAAFLDQGVEPCVIMMALDETAAAPRPSWAYARAILRGCVRDGATTAQGWHDRQARWAGRDARGTVHGFQERVYSEADLRSLCTNLED